MDFNKKEHMNRIVELFTEQMTVKYKKGVKEHGGNLWEKGDIIDFAIDEAIDQVVYLLTLKDQLDSGEYYNLKKYKE